MDLLINIPKEIFDLILQHFNVEELLEYSQVSKSWYQVIGTSKIFASRVWLNADSRFEEPSLEIITTLKNSKRSYENFKLSEQGNGLDLIFSGNHRWKRAKIDIQSFVCYQNYYNILKSIEPDIKDLEIFDMDIDCVTKQFDEPQLGFQKLQRLYFGYLCPISMRPFCFNCENLNILILEEINFMKLNAEFVNHIKEIFSSAENLRKLQLSVEILNLITEDNHQLTFSLEFLCINFSDESQLNITSFQNFLIKQHQLNWIKLTDCSNFKILATVFKSSQCLKRFSLEYFDKYTKKITLKDLSNIFNNSVVHIDLEFEEINTDLIETFLKVLTNLELFYLFHVSEECLNLIIHLSKTIKVIKYCSIYKSFKNNLPKCQGIKLLKYNTFLEDCTL